jgi:oxygen-independent coproporphyrinogen-3 oxidase
VRALAVPAEAEALGRLIDANARADYVYMYPPRQAYRPLSGNVDDLVRASLARTQPINIYIHVPFCRQICAFCNLYAVAGDRSGEHEAYVAAIQCEIDTYAPLIAGRPVDTIYIGGGTPSLLAPRLMARLLEHLRASSLCDPAQVAEVALEVAPDTVAKSRLAGFRTAGINRINLGVQSWDDSELRTIGRSHGHDVHEAALDQALDTGFLNVCVDLIYGLNGQTDASWVSSLHAVTQRCPQTVCCYPLTLRPGTGFAAHGYDHLSDEAQFRRYDLAHAILTEAGYEQETHVRWVMPGKGGYRQKSNHWSGQDVLGVGAGARSYLHLIDTRNGYSVRRRVRTLRDYYARVEASGHARTDGFVMTEDERRRKALILGLGHLRRPAFLAAHGADVFDIFPWELAALIALDLVTVDEHAIALTARGHRHRDVAVQMFFSDIVRELVLTHDYAE